MIKLDAAKNSYKITSGQNFLLLGRMLFVNIFLIGVYLYFFGWRVPTNLFYYVFAFVILLEILPVAVLHLQYWYQNKGAIFEIDELKRQLSYAGSTGCISHQFDEILSLHYYVPYSYGSGWYSFESYRYYRIVFKDGSAFIITCLMMNRIQKKMDYLLPGQTQKHFRLICLIDPLRSKVSQHSPS